MSCLTEGMEVTSRVTHGSVLNLTPICIGDLKGGVQNDSKLMRGAEMKANYEEPKRELVMLSNWC